MTKNTAFPWLPQPSTVIGLGVLAGTFCYLITGDPVWAGVAGAAVKIIVPDNSTGGDRVFEAIATLAQAVGRPLRASAEQPSAIPVAPGNDQDRPCRQMTRTNPPMSGKE
jgi:uncharacterized membrane protein YjjP (DUF1212 family)